jgi:GNAT superfamily N-acetyltransferase
MCDHWMPLVKLRISMEQFQQLPRNAAYKYEYLNRQAYLSPRPRHFHALLDLQRPRAAADKEVEIGPLPSANVMDLANLFAAAFSTIQPYGCLDERTRLRAAGEALARVLAGGDGPFIEGASFVAREREQIVGAILLTLLPLGDPCDYECYEWKSAPPADCIARCQGRPHLTWIFVSPLHAGRGAGTALLVAAATRLREMGFTQLLSTFMIGNESSMLWHWRNGFELLSHPASYRLMKRRWQRYLQPGGDAAEV